MPQQHLLDESGMIPEVEVVSEAISQDALDYLFKPHASSDSGAAPAGDGLGTASTQELDIRPWYRRPSPWLLFPLTIVSAVLFSSTAAPRNEILINLACSYHRPEYYITPVVSPTPLDTAFSALGAVARTMPSADRRCSTDPVVLAAVAKLVTTMSLLQGILTCLTVAWWGQLSDRIGRKFILGLSIFGYLIAEINLVVVTRNQARLPGGYWFLTVTSVLDGFLGGMSTASAATHAYIADCTKPHERSRIFSLFLGTMFIGVAFGPTLGSLVIRATQDILTPYYLAIPTHMTMMIVFFFVIPESLTVEARRVLAEKRAKAEEVRDEVVRRAKEEGREWSLVRSVLGRVFGFLSPLGVFLPRRGKDGQRSGDWNLTLLVLSYGIIFSYMGLMQFKTQYAIAVFGWGAEELGYWLSASGFTRALHLVVVLPLITKLFKPKAAISLPVQPDEPLSSTTETTPLVGSSPSPSSPSSAAAATAAAHFDIRIARGSLAVDVCSFFMVAVARGPYLFVAGSLLASFGGGFGPSAQSIAMYLSDGQESGKLFGALAVVSTLGSSVIGPAVFGAIYVNTVGIFPRAIFVVAAAGVVFALMLVMLIRLPRGPAKRDVSREQQD